MYGGPLSPDFNIEEDDFMQLGPCGPAGDEDMGDIADDLINGAFDRDEAFFGYMDRCHGVPGGYRSRDPHYYHTKIFGKLLHQTEKAFLFEWDDRDKPVKVWIPKGAVYEEKVRTVEGKDYLWVWTKFWLAKQRVMTWSADVQEEHARQNNLERSLVMFESDPTDEEELDCSNFVTKKKEYRGPNPEEADCSSMVSNRHKRKKAREAAKKQTPKMPDTDEFGGF